VQPTLKSVARRSGIFAAVFFVLILLLDRNVVVAAGFTAVLFLLLLGFGLLVDTIFYRMRLRRWEREHGRGGSGK